MNPHVIITKLLKLTFYDQSCSSSPLALDYFEENPRNHIISSLTLFKIWLNLWQKQLTIERISDNTFNITNLINYDIWFIFNFPKSSYSKSLYYKYTEYRNLKSSQGK